MSWDEGAALAEGGLLDGTAGVSRGALGAGGTATGGMLETVGAPAKIKKWKHLLVDFQKKILTKNFNKRTNERY